MQTIIITEKTKQKRKQTRSRDEGSDTAEISYTRSEITMKSQNHTDIKNEIDGQKSNITLIKKHKFLTMYWYYNIIYMYEGT